MELWLVSMAVITIYEFDYREALVNMSQISHHACSNNRTASKATLRVSCWIPWRKSLCLGFFKINKQMWKEGGKYELNCCNQALQKLQCKERLSTEASCSQDGPKLL